MTMPVTTLERAERILAKARELDPQNCRTDIQIIRERHSLYMGSAFTIAFFGLNLVKFSGTSDSNSVVTWGLCLLLYSIAAIMFYQGVQYSRIRKLFEAVGPQNLADLKCHTPSGH
jgi:hypothetical protein